MKICGIGFVYMITSPKGRIYIGSTNDFDFRVYYYKSKSCKGQRKLYNSFKKHGVENHTFEIVWAGPLEEMLKYETLIGWGFNVLEKENLNLRLPKLGDVYSVVSNETKLKISMSNKNSYTEEKRKLQSESMLGEKHPLFGKPGPMTGKTHTVETKLKISEANKNRTDDWKDKLIKSHLGKKCSEETKLKMSESHRGKIKTVEHRENLRKAHTGKKMSQEAIEKMKLSRIGIKQSEETKQKRASASKKPVIQMDLDGNFIREWAGAIDVEKELGISISQCISGRNKKAGGFKWKLKYKENNNE